MSDCIETGSHWCTSCTIDRCLGGRAGQPLCARAWLSEWRLFIEVMAVAFRCPVHCEDIFIRWTQTRKDIPSQA